MAGLDTATADEGMQGVPQCVQCALTDPHANQTRLERGAWRPARLATGTSTCQRDLLKYTLQTTGVLLYGTRDFIQRKTTQVKLFIRF